MPRGHARARHLGHRAQENLVPFDFDGDGRDELAVRIVTDSGGERSDTIRVFHFNGEFVEPLELGRITRLLDFDKDGTLDLVDGDAFDVVVTDEPESSAVFAVRHVKGASPRPRSSHA